MTNNWAIVAIPEKDDSVWKFSSEKVPHMTILSLGEHEAGPLSAKILSYLEHACEVMLHRFSMYSDERTELGPKKADVILFEATRAEQTIVQFRDALLKDPDVLEWFNTSSQFPEWTPHLTMGFPETPAREDTRDYPGIHSVRFDRIALWTGEYDGPEIKLKSYEPTDLLMSDFRESFDLSQKVAGLDLVHRPEAISHVIGGPIPGLNLGKTMGEMSIKPNLELMDFLEHNDMELVMLDGAEWVTVTDAVHFGRKGMKWGVRHKRGSDGTVTESVSSDAHQAEAIKAKIAKAGGVHTLTNDELSTLKKRISLENEYAKATGTDKSALDRKHEQVKKAVDLGKTANDLYKFYNSDVGKVLRSLVMDVPDSSPEADTSGNKKDSSKDEGSGGSKKGRSPRSKGPAKARLLYDATRLGRKSPGFSSPYKSEGNPFIRPAKPKRTIRGTVYGITDL